MSRKNESKSPMTILLVDDHPDTRESLQVWLECEGHKVLAAEDVKSAVKLGREKDFEVMLCDVQLPDGEGSMVLEKLGGRGKLVAIAISGHGSPSDLARSKAAGFFMHVVKPFSTDELTKALAAARLECQKRGTLVVSAAAPNGNRRAGAKA